VLVLIGSDTSSGAASVPLTRIHRLIRMVWSLNWISKPLCEIALLVLKAIHKNASEAIRAAIDAMNLGNEFIL
jgi:hypothetical protein